MGSVVIRIRLRRDAGLGVYLDDVEAVGALELDAGGLDPARAENALFVSGAAAAVDGDHVLISVDWLKAQAEPLADDPSWAAGFEEMLATAREEGRYYSQVEAIRIPGLPR